MAGDVLQPKACCAESRLTVRCVLEKAELLFVKLCVSWTGQCGTCCRKWENNQLTCKATEDADFTVSGTRRKRRSFFSIMREAAAFFFSHH